MTRGRGLVVFDGVCNLCDASVNFIIQQDPAAHFQFVAAQTPAGQAVLARAGATAVGASAVVLVEGGRWYAGSTAALRIARRLRWPWRLLYVLVLVPRPVREAVYQWVGRHRYRWFGRSNVCRVPTAGQRARFLDASR